MIDITALRSRISFQGLTSAEMHGILDLLESSRSDVNRLTEENQRLSDSLSKSIDGQIRSAQETIKWAEKYFRSAFPSAFSGKDSAT